MKPDQLAEVLSSKARRKIANALSVRPRTLSELAAITGISVQGVLKHLQRLEELGLVEERKLAPGAPKARLVYSAKGTAFGDFSSGDLIVLKATKKWEAEGSPHPNTNDLERSAGELLVQRRRIRDEGRRLGKMIDELADDQGALMAALDELDLNSVERLMLQVIFTEETVGEGVEALSKYYGIEDRRSIDKALAKVRRSVDK